MDEPVAPQPPQIIGTSPRLREAIDAADQIARTSIPVLIRGETGTGKELFARRIHERSERAAGPFVAVNCGAIASSLVESELFGHERGAFTGALQAKQGLFELAHRGTLFLDEIGDMALEHQVKVLRAIQEGEIRRVGGTSVRFVDVRIVAASHKDLAVQVAEGTFREDLFHRLEGCPIDLPPLRTRGDDVIAIAKYLLHLYAPGKRLSADAQRLLLEYPWPGNIRRLENVVKAASAFSSGDEITAAIVQHQLRIRDTRRVEQPAPAAATVKRTRTHLGSVRDGRFLVTVAELQAAFGVSRATVYRKLMKHSAAEFVPGEGTGSKRTSGPCGGAGHESAEESLASSGARTRASIAWVKEHGRLTRRDYEKAAGVSGRTARRDLAEMVNRGVLVKVGAGRGASYRIVGRP
jgi:sigma-54 specific flagellar transcriptional regulator A